MIGNPKPYPHARRLIATAAVSVALALCACSGGQEDGTDRDGGDGATGAGGAPPEIGFVVVKPTSVPLTTELTGRTTAYESSDVRPQVSGIIRARFFREGQLVHRGDRLYEIDPRLYKAAVEQSAANLQSAQATAEAARIQAERFRPLAQIQAVSQQDYTNAVAQARQGNAAVAQNRAALATARINLNFTTVPAPITGRIGRSLYTVGALVTAGQASPLAQIQRLDPMFVDIQQSTAAMLALRQSLSRNGIEPAKAVVRIVLPNGAGYAPTGTVEFSEALVDPQTGTVTLRARFPNSDGILLPNMFVRARFAAAIDTRAFLVPQPAISRDPKGNATLFIVGPGNKAISRKVRADRPQGTFWVVTEGLKSGDRVIVQGTGQLRPNQPIRPVPANTPERLRSGQDGRESGSGQGGSGGTTAGAGGGQPKSS